MPRIRMRDDDHAKYGALCTAHKGACPEWVELHLTELVDEETGLLLELEDRRTWDLSAGEFLSGTTRGMTVPLQAMIWLARKKAGCVDSPHTFWPKVQAHSGVLYEPTEAEKAATAKVRGDADPPAPGNRAERRAVKKAPAKKSAESRT